KLHAPPVVEVAHAPPGRVALDPPLLARHAALGAALLELDCVHPGQERAVDQLPGQLQRSVVVDPDLGDHEHGLAVADRPASDAPHALPRAPPPAEPLPPRTRTSHSANSRKAPSPPRADARKCTIRSTSGMASAGAPMSPRSPMAARAGRSFRSSPM